MKTTNHAYSINGKPVVNAMRKVRLHISAMDVKKGSTKDPGACAAALAAMREVPNCIAARIHIGRAYLLDSKTNKWLRFKTPEALRSEVVAFDRGGKFEPGDYELRPMSPSEMKPKHPGAGSKDPDRGNYISSQKGKNPRKLHVTKGVRQWGANR